MEVPLLVTLTGEHLLSPLKAGGRGDRGGRGRVGGRVERFKWVGSVFRRKREGKQLIQDFVRGGAWIRPI